MSWTDKYKEFLESVLIDKKNAKDKNKQYITNYKTYCSDTEVKFILKFPKALLERLMTYKDKNGDLEFEIVFKLKSRIHISNMNLYNKNNTIQHFDNELEILEYYYDERVRIYKLRQEYMINDLKNE